MKTAIARTDNSVLGRWWWSVDHFLLGALFALLGTGVVLAFSATPPVAERLKLETYYLIKHQVVFLMLSVAVMLGISMQTPQTIRRLSCCVLAAAFVLLVMVLAHGSEIKGSSRWIRLFGISVQPSEIAKPAFAVTAAWLIALGKQQEKFRRIQQSVEYKQATITRQNPSGGRLLKKKMHAVKAQERRFEKQWEERTEVPDTEDAIYLRLGRQIPMPKGKEVLDYELDQLTADGKLLAEKIHLRIRGPEKVCIIGKNGVGKTTLLKQIAQELLSRKDLHAAYMPQNYGDLLPGEKTPLDFLQTKGDKEELTRIRTWLGSMKFTAEEMEHPIRELSGGQKAKLFFMKMSLEESDVLILDEPTRNFSPMSNPVIRRILADYQGAILCVSHDRKFIEEVCTEVYELTRDGLKRCSLVGNE